MQVHVLDVFIENASKTVRIIQLNTKHEIQTKVELKFECIFLYNALETSGVRQGMSKLHSDVMGSVFHSGDAWDSML